jgi:hypothetical protein
MEIEKRVTKEGLRNGAEKTSMNRRMGLKIEMTTVTS